LRNQEAARYARWAAMTAGSISLIVVGFYAERALRAHIVRRHGPSLVPETVQQQSAGVSYSFSNQDGTTFTIRASHATQFKEGDRAELQDVWVTIYGKKGNRNDNIHTRECSYQPEAGNVQCTGDVEIDMQGIGPQQGASAAQTVHVTTSNVTFDRETGEASTPAPVNLTFPGGQGRGVGLQYDSREATLQLQRNVAFAMASSQDTGGFPVSATAANLEFNRDDRAISLGGPVVMHQGDRQLTAEHVSIALDKQYHAQQISAEGNPVASGNENGASFTVAAKKFEGTLDPTGAIQQITADQDVTATRKSHAGEDHFTAAHVEIAMAPGHNLLQQLTATGGVSAESRDGANARTLKTNALQINFAAPSAARGGVAAMDKQTIESAETLGPATIESKVPSEALNVKAAKFVAQFAPDGKLQRLRGRSGVEITRTAADGVPQTSTATELAITFSTGGDWSTLDETGNVRLSQDGKLATAARAQFQRATGTISLEGSPVFSDTASRTSAGSVTINQKTGDIRATGGVISTGMAQSTQPHKQASANAAANPMGNIALGEGDPHISGDVLTGSMTTGDVTFRGHARLWQGQAVLDADQISVSQKDGKLQATGEVVAVFPQASGEGPQIPSVVQSGKNSAKNSSQPMIWQIRAEQLTYSSDVSMAHLEGGVTASSEQGSLHARTLDVYLAPPASRPTAPGTSALGARGLERAVAQGNVIVSQNGVHGYAEQAAYDAARGKFVFSGGQPRITDGNGNTTTGHSLTFDVASDTISVDSEEGSRTLTRHRVEK
jgi:lipopolysaccharide export system protein LptA